MQVVMNLSNRQARDLMYIRRLNLTQRCNLSAERKALMHQMALSESEALINRSDNLSTVSKLAARLQQNTAEDRQVYYKLARATYRGVSSRNCVSVISISITSGPVLCQMPAEPLRAHLACMQQHCLQAHLSGVFPPPRPAPSTFCACFLSAGASRQPAMQVLSSRQLSEAMVHAYPYIAVVETLLDTLADQRGEPSKDSIVAAAHLHPMIQEWQDFIHYVSQFDQSCCYDYVPVLPQT